MLKYLCYYFKHLLGIRIIKKIFVFLAQIADQIACRGLDTVEEKVPFLMKSPEQLVEDARKLCHSTLEMGYQKVEGFKTMGNETLSSVKNYGLQKADDMLAGSEELVDKYLPPAFGEGMCNFFCVRRL